MGPSPIQRVFAADALDLDDLAEAIRLLLLDDTLAPAALPNQAQVQPDLPSSPRRGTHMVEANEALEKR